MTRLFVLATLLAFAAPASAGKYNETLKLGDAAPAWSGLPGVDGKSHSLDDLKDKDAVVVVFTCNSCPCARDYEARIKAFAAKHAGRVAVVAVNPNKTSEDSFAKMQERAKAQGFPYPYLHDADQKLARAYGAEYTPEFFVLDRERKVAYMGAMDDRDPPAEPTASHLDEAVRAVLDGKTPATAETLGRGCRVRYERKRR